MGATYSSSPCVVVGIDGSRSAMYAALWAVDEAVERDVALRLVCAIDSPESAPAATAATREACAAIEAAHKPVKVEVEIVHGRPIATLIAESRSAAMVCVGSAGLKHTMYGRIGSTASALATSAHCSVAVVPVGVAKLPAGLVLAVVDESPLSKAVLELAVQEAALRSAPLRVLTSWPPRGYGPPDIDQAAATAARVERYLAQWRRRNPAIDIQLVANHGNVVTYLEYLHRNDEPVQLLVVDPRRPGPVETLLGPSGRAALDATRCTLLICGPQCWL